MFLEYSKQGREWHRGREVRQALKARSGTALWLENAGWIVSEEQQEVYNIVFINI